MKRTVLLIVTSLALASCAQPALQKSLTVQDLDNHRFVLHSVNGTPFIAKEERHRPELNFGDKLHISGAMCNRFFGQATLQGDQLKAEGLAMTRMMCSDPQLNALDNQIGQMLSTGAHVSLKGTELTLKSDQHSLTYTLAHSQ